MKGKKNKLKVLINGLGRIGRAIVRINIEKNIFDIVAINDINPDNKNIAYLIKYDCTYGKLENKITNDENNLYIDNTKIKLSHCEDIKDVDMSDADIVIEATGIYKNIKSIENICKKTDIKRFIITNADSDKANNIIFGVNEENLIKKDNKIISSSICDAISLGPIYSILSKKYKIESGFLVTLHPWLSYQNLLDGAAKSWSQPGDVYSHYALGRASTQNLIPKSTSAVRALANVCPDALEKICSFSYRTPTQIVASAVLTLVLKDKISIDEIINIFKQEENTQKYKIIQTTNEPLISIDYVKNDYSVILDTRWIQVNNERHIELVYWYDNEWGYSSRIVDIVKFLEEVI